MSISKIQSRLKAPKGQENKFGKYKYRSCEDIVEAVKPLLDEYDYHLNISDEMIMLGDRFYVKATASVMTDKRDIIEAATGYAREPLDRKGMDESQITGAASSYARKYALNGLFAIDDTKDADSMDNTQPVHRFKKGEAESITFQVKACLDSGDELGLKEVLDEYQGQEEKMKVWGLFTSAERTAIKNLMGDNK